MADLPVPKDHYLVSPTKEIEDKWIEVRIQDRKSQISRYRQDIEDLQKSKMVDLEARILMLEMEIKELEAKRDAIEGNKEGE